ncbi:hypothetical protein niasHT_037124 [Heterodera trifolii]|uniref:SAM domain-containing protein n=1 Tax=Heterodera trifolii TaxID=157864 RepID=A0ABD2INC7_9BILA
MDLVRDNQNLHKFGLQVQQLLAAELFGFDNINNLKWELKREFGYSVDEKAEEFGYPSFKDMLDSKVLDNYVEIEMGRFSEGGQMVQTRYKAKHDRHTTAVRQQQIIFQREKERKEERRQRQMERNFDAQMWRPSEKFGQPSAGGKSFSNYYESQQQQNHRFYAQREHSPAMEMNGALDSNWYTNEDDDNNRNNNGDGIDNGDEREEAKPTAKEQQKQHKSPPKKVGGVSEWSSGSGDEQQQPSEEEEKPKPTQEQKLTTKHKFIGISSWTKTEHPKEQQLQQQPKQQLQEQHISVSQKSAKLISLSSDEEEEEETRRKPPPPMARHANKKPLSVTALKKIIWSEDEDNTNETKGHGANSPPPAMFAPLSANFAAGTSTAANNIASTSNYNNAKNATGTSNFGFDCPPVDSNPSRWSAETLCRWLTAAGLADCAQRLLNEEVDGACLLLFTHFHYQNLGLKMGPLVKLQQMAEYLRQFTFADGR